MTLNSYSFPAAELAELDLGNPCLPEPGLMTGGCPSDADLARLKQAGFKTALDLRPSTEWNGDDFAGRVERAGLVFLQLPVSGVDTVDQEQMRQFWAYWNNPSLKPMLVHCASGNRVGALLALAAYQCGGLAAEEAMQRGLAAGLKASEAMVRARLKL